MEYVTVASTVTTFVGIIGTNVEVPHRERGVNILGRGEDSIGRNYHSLGVLRSFHLVITKDSLWCVLIEKTVAGCKAADGADSTYDI
jgi:hypothetical protein